MALALRPKTESEIDHRKAVLSLRWLLVILASYLTLFSYIGSEQFPVAFGIALAFSVTNIVLIFVPRQQFMADRTLNRVAILDLVFVSLTLYLLRIQGNYLYLGFLAIFVLALLWRDLQLVLVSLFVVSIVFGVFNYFRFINFQIDVNIEQFLTLALFFVVAILYLFLSERLTQDAKRAKEIIEENRIAEAMVEMTRALSSSLNSDDV